MHYLVEQRFIEKAAPIEDMFSPIISWGEWPPCDYALYWRP